MIWLLRDFDLLAVVLRAAVLAFESLTVGAVAYSLFVAASFDAGAANRSRRLLAAAAVGLVLSSALSTAVTSAMVMSASGLHLGEIAGASFFIAGVVLCLAASAIWICSRSAGRSALWTMAVFSALAVAASVSESHASSRMDHRWLLSALTAAHHFGVALWIGSMPFLLASLRRIGCGTTGKQLLTRYSRMAVAGIVLLVLSGAGLGWFYFGFSSGGDSHPATALYGTAYGVMLLAKLYLFALMLVLGAGSVALVRKMHFEPERLLARLRRFSEAEIGLGFTAVLAAASLTSQPPAIDLVSDRLTTHEIAARFRVMLPSMRSPPVAALTPPASIESAVVQNEFRGVSVSDANDNAWSEFNHHWAGLIVLAAGALALLGRRAGWARHWPLVFAMLAIFILLRADPENWPLGPRPFWASFSQPDVLQHRLYAALILGFAGFEWRIQTGNWRRPRGLRFAALIFPALCAVGAALMLLHSHALGNIKEELLAEMSHTAIALLGATAGWSRWLELRLPPGRESRTAGYLWPACLMLAGLVLLNYRES